MTTQLEIDSINRHMYDKKFIHTRKLLQYNATWTIHSFDLIRTKSTYQFEMMSPISKYFQEDKME